MRSFLKQTMKKVGPSLERVTEFHAPTEMGWLPRTNEWRVSLSGRKEDSNDSSEPDPEDHET